MSKLTQTNKIKTLRNTTAKIAERSMAGENIFKFTA